MWPFTSTHLPFASGPYIPGCVDIMTEYSKEGLFFRLYYPTNEKSPIQAYKKDWLPWIPHDSYIHGFARVIMAWVLLVRLVLFFVSGKLYIPAVYGAKIRKSDKLKCIIFSHGLGGGRFLYSTTCIELASRGFLVVVIEHRDESAGSTYYYKNVDDIKNNKKTYINFVPVKLGPNHYLVRNSQVIKRAEECTKLGKLIVDINSGKIPYNILKNLANEEKNEFQLEDLEGSIDVDDLNIMGHSFGAATALLTLYKNKKLFRRGIILDPWMFPVKDMPEITDISHPLVFINTQTFHISTNVKMIEKYVENNVEKRPIFTILHTTHENQTDSVFAGGYWLNWFMKKITAEHAMKINNSIILSFLNKEMNLSVDINDCERYLTQENENYVVGIEGLQNIIKVEYKSFFKIIN